MSKELHIALQNAIGDLGTDVLKSPFLVNILQDYGAFDVHDKDSVAIKDKMSVMFNNGQLCEIPSWKNLSKEEIQSKGLKLLRNYDSDRIVRHIINSILMALEMPTLPKLSSLNPKSTIPSKHPSPAIPNNSLSTQQSKDNDRLSGKNIGCAILSAIIFIPCGLILFSINEIGGGLACLFGALIGVIGPFANPDFWKWNGY